MLHSSLTFDSIHGRSESLEETEQFMKGRLPTGEGMDPAHRVVYVIHRFLKSTNIVTEDESTSQDGGHQATELLGSVALNTLCASSLVLPENLTLSAAANTTTLTVELGYMILPIGWNKGYATESIMTVFEACRKARSFWYPFSKLYIRAIVDEENPASLRVMEKIGMAERGIYDWGESKKLHIFGVHLLE